MLGKQAELRRRVEQQAYLYRVNADVRGDKMYAVEEVEEGEARSGGRQVGDRVGGLVVSSREGGRGGGGGYSLVGAAFEV